MLFWVLNIDKSLYFGALHLFLSVFLIATNIIATLWLYLRLLYINFASNQKK